MVHHVLGMVVLHTMLTDLTIYLVQVGALDGRVLLRNWRAAMTAIVLVRYAIGAGLTSGEAATKHGEVAFIRSSTQK